MKISRWLMPLLVLELFVGGIAGAKGLGVWREREREAQPMEQFVPDVPPSGDGFPM
jgi:hypothetical protein